uniref:Uncharacterized protein TCIL3000_11_8210 n=1 Tax=Trypanosoma congolense (strain IL3000) TaxID=1068625 RepID=G0V150_TRYCI|nr:unnamed protein product [Trypanosoma congolense IL3000]
MLDNDHYDIGPGDLAGMQGGNSHINSYEKHCSFLPSEYADHEDLLRDERRAYMEAPPKYPAEDSYAGYGSSEEYRTEQHIVAEAPTVGARRLSKDRLTRGGGLNIFSWNTDVPTANQPRGVRDRNCAELQRLKPVDSSTQRDKEVREKFEANTQSRFLCFSGGDSPERRRGVRVFNAKNNNNSEGWKQNSGMGHGRRSERNIVDEPPAFVSQRQERPPHQDLPPAGLSSFNGRREGGGIPGFAGMGENKQQNPRRGRGVY